MGYISRPYKKEYISDYSIDDYNRYLNSPSNLAILKNNYFKRYAENSSNYDGYYHALKESLDHYVLKRIEENPQFLGGTQGQNYLNHIINIIRIEKAEIYNNIAVRTIIRDPNLRKYLINKVSYNLIDEYNNVVNKINAIKVKIERNILVTQYELDTICAFVVDSRDSDDEMYTSLIKYIYNNLNHPLCKQNGLHCSLQVINAIFNYVPLFARDNFEKFKQNGFDPTGTRFYIVDDYHTNKYNKYGTSCGSKKHIIFSKEKIKNLKFGSIESAAATFNFLSCNQGNKKFQYDYCSLILIAAHELVHQFQNHESKKMNINSTGFMYAVREILDQTLDDYCRNHDNEDIEINATEIGWNICQQFFKKILREGKDRDRLISRAIINEKGTTGRYAFALKRESNGSRTIKDEYDYRHLNEIMSDPEKRKRYFSMYPMLRKIYNDDGSCSIMKVLTLPPEFTLRAKGPTIGSTYVNKAITILLTNEKFRSKYIKEIAAIRNPIPIMNIMDNLYSPPTVIFDSIKLIRYYIINGFDKKDMFEKIDIDERFLNNRKIEYDRRYNATMLIFSELKQQNNNLLSNFATDYINRLMKQNRDFNNMIYEINNRINQGFGVQSTSRRR